MFITDNMSLSFLVDPAVKCDSAVFLEFAPTDSAIVAQLLRNAVLGESFPMEQ